jgi:hypothetical protein
MTEDPVKLYVIVMAILLCVLSYVALDSYKQAHALEAAIQRAPREAEEMRQLASEVNALVNQIAKSELKEAGGQEKVLVERVEKNMRLTRSGYESDTIPIGRGVKGNERRFKFDYGTGRNSPPLDRQQIGRFCEAVERASGGIIKTIELGLRRATGEGLPEPGKVDKVTDDRYKATIVFGLRVVNG